jgi:hypothetical protein
MPALQRETRRKLVATLQQIATLETANGRDLLLLDWPPALRASLTITNTLAVDLNDIIFKAINWPSPDGQLPPLALLLENAQDLVRGSSLEQTLRDLQAQVLRELAPAPAQPTTEPAQAQAPVPEAERATRFGQVADAFQRRDYAAVLLLAQGLPPAYPGLAPLLTRARAQVAAAEAAANAIAELFANGDWQGVLDREAQYRAQGVAILPQAQLIIDLARQSVAPAPVAPGGPSP